MNKIIFKKNKNKKKSLFLGTRKKSSSSSSQKFTHAHILVLVFLFKMKFLNEKLVHDEFELVLDDGVDSIGEDSLVRLLRDHIGLVRVVDVNWIGDTPGDERRRMMQELGTEHVIVHLESTFCRQVLEFGHLACHAYEREIVDAIETVVVEFENIKIRCTFL